MRIAGLLRLGPMPALVAGFAFAPAAGLAFAPAASADCNTVTNSTLCASGTVTGSSGAPTDIPAFDPYPCYGTPTCDFYDNYDPGVIFDRPGNGGRPGLGGNRPQPR
jgi:hypothetical protein